MGGVRHSLAPSFVEKSFASQRAKGIDRDQVERKGICGNCMAGMQMPIF
ncbi:hypothetical protein CES86_4678 [Brucella lupini]|uniref:Uncharacterized protein n=1 Tax=Brucella lupini TaxID=255457 RepID=A0A256GB83_9HYPH|nr:hypothetical protein CES86_4678 [Brucella lupini]